MIMLPAVELVCDYQGKVDTEQSKMGRINRHKFQDREDFTLALRYYTWMKNNETLYYRYLHLNVWISYHISEE